VVSGNYKINYYESESNAKTDTGAIAKDVLYEIPYNDFDKTLYVRVTDNTTYCVRTGSIKIVTNPKIEVADVELTACDGDNDGKTEFNLALVQDDISIESGITFTYFSSLEDAQKNQNPISNIDSYTNKDNQDYVYVRVEENPSIGTRCPSLAKIKLITYYPPNPLPREVYICPGTETVLDAGDFDEYSWSTGETTREKRADEPGIYSVKVTKYLNYGFTCSATFEIEVKSLSVPVIMDLIEGTDYITVIAKGPAPLEYSIDNVNWQTNNTFSNLEPGIYTFYVRSVLNGCEGNTSQGIIFRIPNVITPNGDGYNDVWKLCGLDLFEGGNSHIRIFNRYGKQVFEQDSNTCFVWDGKYLGRILQTTSYWYIINIADGRQFTGWIVLRNHDEGFGLW
jgi:gliding motility-associated-like protein